MTSKVGGIGGGNVSQAAVLKDFADLRSDILTQLARELVGPSGAMRVLDMRGDVIWPEGAAVPAGGVTVPLGIYGGLRIVVPETQEPYDLLQGRIYRALGTVLEGYLESEIELNRLMDEHVTTTNQLIAIFNITRSTNETWELGGKLQVIVEEAGRQTGCRRAILEIEIEGETKRFIWRSGAGEDPDTLGKILESVHANDEAHVSPPPLGYIATPIKVHDAATGWIIASERKSSASPFVARDLKILQVLSDLAAGFVLTSRLQNQVIENLRTEKELETASQIQRMLIPRNLPRVPRFELGAACRPARQVGGDFYNVQETAGGDLVFALGDVAGKGVPAALLMAMTRSVCRTLRTMGSSPDEALSVINDVLYEDLTGAEKFVTLVVGRYYAKDRRIELANAGHSPVFHLPAGAREPALLEPQAPPIGVIPDLAVESTVLELSPGSILAIASDGLHEMPNAAGELMGIERVGRALARAASKSSGEIVTQLLAEAQRFSGGSKQWDDQTLLILKATND
jgi:sigma-B regulation protein RsbU (phosphoserine phosphatase)